MALYQKFDELMYSFLSFIFGIFMKYMYHDYDSFPKHSFFFFFVID